MYGKFIFFLIFCIMFASCSESKESEINGKINTLEEKREKWKEKGPDNYQFKLRSRAGDKPLQPAKVFVRSDTVSAVINLELGDTLSILRDDSIRMGIPKPKDSLRSIALDKYRSVDGFFRRIEKVIKSKKDMSIYSVDYDSTMGYPKEIIEFLDKVEHPGYFYKVDDLSRINKNNFDKK